MTIPRLLVAVEEDAVDDATDHANCCGNVEDLLPRLQRLLNENENSVRALLSSTHVFIGERADDVRSDETGNRGHRVGDPDQSS